MKTKEWQQLIPEERLSLFDALFEEFFSESVGWKALFHQTEYDRYLHKPLSPSAKRNLYQRTHLVKSQITRKRDALLRRAARLDRLTNLFEGYVQGQLAGTQAVRASLTVGGRRRKGFKGVRSGNLWLARAHHVDLVSSFLDILCLLQWKFTIRELVELATIGDQQSAFRLVEINKRFLGATWMVERIIQAERFDDDRFFVGLGRATQRNAIREHRDRAEIGFAVLLLWHIGFKDLPHRELLDYLHKKFRYESDLPSFSVLVNRLGLKKYRIV